MTEVLPANGDRHFACFVNRLEATVLVQDMVARPTGLTFVELQGVEGGGKTFFLRRMHELLRGDAGLAIALLSLRTYAPFPGKSPPAGQAPLIPNCEKYRQLLIALAGQLGEFQANAFASFADAALPPGLDVTIHGADVHGGTVNLGPGAQISSAGNVASASLSVNLEVDPEAEAEQNRVQLTESFLECATKLQSRYRLVILLDDYNYVIDQLVGFWLLTDVMSRLNNAVVIIARQASPQVLPGNLNLIQISLDNLTKPYVLAFLRKRFPGAANLDELADAIFEFSSGHPEAVSMAADLIEQRCLTGGEIALDDFRNLPAGRTEQLSKLVDHIIEGVDDPDVCNALKVAWVVRHFDAGILAALLTSPGESPGNPERFADIVKALQYYSFTQYSPSVKAWRFNEFIRIERDRELASIDPDGYELLHQRAASYFARRMTDEDQSKPSETSYARTLRHDAPMWQSLERDLIYHLAHLRDRRHAGIALATMYLRVFYWYGWYQPYSLCKKLLDDWSSSQQADEDRDWLEVLQNFCSSYPIVWSQQKADWDAVEGTMLAMRDVGGLDGEPSLLTPEQRRLRALTDLFTAQSRLRRTPPDYSGYESYEEARMLIMEFPEDHWLLPWVAFWIGQSALEEGDLQKASAECQLALQLGMQQGDDEAIASAWQFRGDIRWQRDDLMPAIQAYLLAIYIALRFLRLPEHPDSYTLAFHREICEGTTKRLRALWRSGQKEVTMQACVTIREGLAELWRSLGMTINEADFRSLLDGDDDRALRSALLLDVPSDDLLKTRMAPYRMRAVLTRHIEKLQADEFTNANETTGNQPRALGDAPHRLRWDLEPGGTG
jgi:hypothetical protein